MQLYNILHWKASGNDEGGGSEFTFEKQKAFYEGVILCTSNDRIVDKYGKI